MNKKRNLQDKARIVMEFINTCNCCRIVSQTHHISDHIPRLERQVHAGEEGKQAFLNKGGKTKSHVKAVGNLKRIIEETAVVNDVLKKALEGTTMRMQAVHEISKETSLNKALQYYGMSKHAWYYTKKPRDVLIHAEVTDKVRKISFRQPTYGTRRMAAQVTKETGIPTNRKKIRRI